MIPNYIIGRRCREFRVREGFTQSDVAKETGYFQTNISRFELGKNDNMSILLWYFAHGMTFKDLIGG